MEMEMAMEKGI